MKPVFLLILDGWGCRRKAAGNAIRQASTPHLDRLFRDYPCSFLQTSGEAVGLPRGQMGNSEVGHLNIGSGRVVYQELTRISRAIRTGDFYHNPFLAGAVELARDRGGSLHLIGLVSDGGVHSHYDHLLALLELARRAGLRRVFIHAILDGRDVLPASAGPFLEDLFLRSRDSGFGQVATVAGRYYAMDRDRRWDRTAKAYHAYVYGTGLRAADPVAALEQAYNRGETDEFVSPTVIVDKAGKPLTVVGPEDSVIFFNFRPDRARQISRAFVDADFPHFDRGINPPLPHYVTMTEYDHTLPAPVAFAPDYLEGTLGEVVSSLGLPQLRVAETEKYAHVTFFFNGGREKPFPGEERILVPSPQVATYDLQPEMSAPAVTEVLLEHLRENRFPLIVANYANADMVGHTGYLEAALKAIETVDRCVGALAAEALPRGRALVLCSDHGNAEQMVDAGGGRHTAHTTNLVPLLVAGGGVTALRPRGSLADVAPTVLDLAGVPPSPGMTGRSMILRRET